MQVRRKDLRRPALVEQLGLTIRFLFAYNPPALIPVPRSDPQPMPLHSHRSASTSSRTAAVTPHFDPSRVFLALVLTPALIFFMSRKAIDHAPSASSAPQLSEQWSTSNRFFAQHDHAVAVPAPLLSDSGAASLIYGRAMFLAGRYDSRPYWNHPTLEIGAPATRYTADLAIEHLIPCESMGRPVNRPDTNGKMSYGILQFQDWDEWQKVSGITGDPDNTADAIRMAEWAIQNGMINHWTCASILKITRG